MPWSAVCITNTSDSEFSAHTGFTVFYSSRKYGWGAGRDLSCVYAEDAWWLQQELKARGIEEASR